MKIRLIYPQTDYLNDVQDVPRAFSPYLEITANADDYLEWNFFYADGFFHAEAVSNVFGKREGSLEISDADIGLYKKLTKRFLKNFLYDFLSDALNLKLPYGGLTGVRPTKLYYELDSGKDRIRELISEFRVSERRAKLIADCVKNQEGYINSDPESVAVFVNIPFCPTRCSYCSFISTEVARVRKELPFYAECVRKETEAVLNAIAKSGKKIKSIYVGGGTPGSIGAALADIILSPFKNIGVEFTVEAGRPDAMEADFIKILKSNNVTRVSVNPQSFNQVTLDAIGRKHSVEDICRAYDAVKDDFTVNMDLIAGLPGENIEDFCRTVNKTLELRPENITIHTLSLKRGSVMVNVGAVKQSGGVAECMTDYAMDELNKEGYLPYYMYRQKNTADNLENVGYTLSGKQCVYNIDMMEESITVLGVGAGAMSKLVKKGRIERLANPKGFREYVGRIEDIISKKEFFFNGLFKSK